MRIAIASGKGGAGKTSVAASLASVWDSPLVAVDTDVEAPNLHLFLPPQVEGSSKAWLEVPSLDLAACSKCGKCREICSFKAIASFAGNISIFPDMCHGCGGCFAVCADKALKPVGRELGELEHDAVLKPDTEAATTDQMLTLVKSELGLAFMPEPMAAPLLASGELVQLHLQEIIPSRSICLVYDHHRPLNTAARKFQQLLTKAGARSTGHK